MRGCIRKCSFCGVWKIEPNRQEKTSKELVEEIEKVGKNRVIFFDNNFLANRNIKQILLDLSNIKIKGHPVIFESQSGFDGRLLQRKPELADLLKQANFQNVRIAWDNSVTDAVSVQKQLNLLTKAGYRAEDIYIFMIYNYNIIYEDLLKKLNYCKRWGVQIADCRYRPLESYEDNYNPAKFRTGQTKDEYYIHEASGWTDKKVRNFRKKVRQHNIWIRYAKDKGVEYDRDMERWSAVHTTFKFFNMGKPPQYEVISNSKVWEERLR